MPPAVVSSTVRRRPAGSTAMLARISAWQIATVKSDREWLLANPRRDRGDGADDPRRPATSRLSCSATLLESCVSGRRHRAACPRRTTAERSAAPHDLRRRLLRLSAPQSLRSLPIQSLIAQPQPLAFPRVTNGAFHSAPPAQGPLAPTRLCRGPRRGRPSCCSLTGHIPK